MAEPAKRAASRAAALPMMDAQSRGWALVASAACVLPLLLQLPRTLAVGIGITGAAVAALSWQRRVPGWLRLLVAVSLIGLVLAQSRFAFGRDTGCALLAAMLAIKPLEFASIRDGRSLLGFALFAPFAAFLLDQGPLSLLLGLLGATLVMAALLRLSDVEAGEAEQAVSTGRRLVTVSRLVAIGLPLALAAFWLFPRIATPLWGVPERALARPGLSDSMTPGEWIDLVTDDTAALRVTFDGPAPPTSEMYFRGPVLWNFDGRTWTQPMGFRHVPAAPTLPSSRRIGYTMEVEPTDRRQLVALELAITVPDGVERSLDHGLYTARPLTTTTRWRMQSSPPVAFEPDLRPTLRQAALRLPDGYNPRTLALARRWRAEAGAGARADAAIVERGLQWIRDEFAYTLDTPLLGRHTVDEFLFEQKAGFCEHYAGAFVVLLRASGIPARVVTGYVGGYRNRYGNYWLVRQADAHAWVEAWLPGRGWTRVDPTAAVAPERIYDTLDDRGTGGLGAFDGLNPVLDMGDWMRRGWNELVLGFDATRQQQLLRPLGFDELDPGELTALFALLGGLALAGMLWLVARSEREADPLLRAWHRFGARHARLGLAREPSEPASEWADRVAAAHPSGPAVRELCRRFVEWRYARHPEDRSAIRALVRDLRRHRP